jgi:hypothetical protein
VAALTPSRVFQRFKIGFVALVFGGLAVAVLVEHSRPSRSDLPVFEPAAPVQLDPLELPIGAYTLAGRVSERSGAPVEGVLIELTQGGEPRWTYSGADGSFALDGLFAGDVAVSLTQLGHPPVIHEASVPCDPVRWDLPEAYAPIEGLPEIRRAALYGRVTSPLGRSLDEYEVILEPTADNPPLSGAIPRRVRIIRDGLFTLTDLALGDYRAFVLPPWADGGDWPRLSEQRYEHLPGAPDLPIVLDAGELAGSLVQEGGRPLAGALITVWDAEHPDRVWTPQRSTHDGAFTIPDLSPARYVVELRAGGTVLERTIEVRARVREHIDFGPVRIEAP